MQQLNPSVVHRVIPVEGNNPDCINNPKHGNEVIFVIKRNVKADYLKAAEHANESDAQVVSLQYEFGMYGGERGSYMRDFVNQLNKPLVTTLHTMTNNFSDVERETVQMISEKSAAVVVISEAAIQMARNYGMHANNFVVIPHGHDEPIQADKEKAKEALGLSGRFVISNIGFVMRYKGIDLVLDAMPELVESNPKILHLIAGKLWPPMSDPHEVAFRNELKEKILKYGLEENVKFVDKWLTESEKKIYYQASDVILTTYRDSDQISSGTLADAVGNGNATISTGYVHAKKVLGDGRGLICDPTPQSIASSVKIMFNDEVRHKFERRMRGYGKNSTWPKVAERYLEVMKTVIPNTLVKAENSIIESRDPGLALVGLVAALMLIGGYFYSPGNGLAIYAPLM